MNQYKDIALGLLLGILIAYLVLPKKVLMITSDEIVDVTAKGN
jgi:hypothetical protein